jgi:hypothetical protein
MLIQEAEHLLNSVIRILFNNTVSLTKTESVSDPANTLWDHWELMTGGWMQVLKSTDHLVAHADSLESIAFSGEGNTSGGAWENPVMSVADDVVSTT